MWHTGPGGHAGATALTSHHPSGSRLSARGPGPAKLTLGPLGSVLSTYSYEVPASGSLGLLSTFSGIRSRVWAICFCTAGLLLKDAFPAA